MNRHGEFLCDGEWCPAATKGDSLKWQQEALDVVGLSGGRCAVAGGQVTLVVHLPDGSCFQNVSKGRHTSSASDSCRT